MNILVATEQHSGAWNKTSFEALAAGQQIAAETGGHLTALVIGKGIVALADELAGAMKFFLSSTICSTTTRPTVSRSRSRKLSLKLRPIWSSFRTLTKFAISRRSSPLRSAEE